MKDQQHRRNDQSFMNSQGRYFHSLLAMACIVAFCITQPSMGLVITEVMYHPVEEGGIPSGDEKLEFIELYNEKAVFEELSGYSFTNGVKYTFPYKTILGAKEYLVVAKNPADLEAEYEISGVHGPFTGKLNNNGERIELSNTNGEIIISFRYNDAPPWPPSADGTGHTLILTKLRGDPEEASSWSPSTLIGGSPGGPEEFRGGNDYTARLVINELLANSDAGNGMDRLELYNPGPVEISLNNIYISDGRFELLKYKIPDGTVLQPGDFWSITEDPTPETPDPGKLPFALSYTGETIFLTEVADPRDAKPMRVLDAVRYGVVEPDISLGRFPDGSEFFGPLKSQTFGNPNDKPLVSDIVINEIMYHYATRDERYEYVELYNKGTETVSLEGWSFTDGIRYDFNEVSQVTEIAAGSYLVVAKDPDLLESVYGNLSQTGPKANLVGPYKGELNDHSERIRLSYPFEDPETHDVNMVTVDKVTYYDGGRWPKWADGEGASLELRDPRGNNNTPDAWANSDESGKTTWKQYSFTISGSDTRYTRDSVNVFDLMLLNRGEILIDDIELIISYNRVSNGGFESGESGWRILGNHVQSYVTTADDHSGSRSLHLIATGHGDPGANRINRSISGSTTSGVTFRFWARWLRGCHFLLLRASNDRSPRQPPRPAHSFDIDIPLDIGTPGLQNTAYVSNRGPDILNVQHAPVLPQSGEPIVVTALVSDNDGVGTVNLRYRSEGAGGFSSTPMVDNGSGNDMVGGDGIYTATIPGTGSGTMRAFYIEASDGSKTTRFPTVLGPTADAPDRTCMVRVGDLQLDTPFATYRIWMSNDVLYAFDRRPDLSNELLDCTFVYNDTEVFYNTAIRHRGSPFLRSGYGRDPYPSSRHGFRIEFNSDQKFGNREEINLDGTEGSSRGPLQERASYWFYRQMGLEYSTQEFVRPIMNGNTARSYEDVQKVDGDYIDAWFPEDNDGHLHKVDDYFEYNVNGTGHSHIDEGLKYDSSHPLLKETYRWGFEKRSHRENDDWDHLFDFAVAINTSSSDPSYESKIESVMHPEHFAKVLAVRHAVGDWDSYGFNRGKNNFFYHAMPEDKWYLLPWDIDFALGSGRGASDNLFSISGNEFPEVAQFLYYEKYKRLYLQAFAELVYNSWKTSYGTGDPRTDFDIFLDDAANALIADGAGDGRRDGIKAYVRSRRSYILTQIPPSPAFEITTNSGQDFCTSNSIIMIVGIAPITVSGISVNGTPVPSDFSVNNVFSVNIIVEPGLNFLELQGLNVAGNPVSGAIDSVTVNRTQPCVITSVTPGTVCNNGTVQLTIYGTGFEPGAPATVTLNTLSEDIGIDALYVQSNEGFDRIDAATLLLDYPEDGVGDPVNTVHQVINLWNGRATASHGVFTENETTFAPPFDGSDPSKFAVRFKGYIYAPSPGVRYFGVNSDDGFTLSIDGQLVGEFADIREAATTDATKNKTDGTMIYNFPSAGSYYMVLDYFENNGGQEVELFQTNSGGGNAKLINVDAELILFRDDASRIEATNVVVVDENTITCQVNLSGAELGMRNLVVTTETSEAAECGGAVWCNLADALQITGEPAAGVNWTVLPTTMVQSSGPEGGPFTPNQHNFTILNPSSHTIGWSVSKDVYVNWLDLPAATFGTLGASSSVPVSVTLNAAAESLPAGIYTCPLVFSIGCNPSGPSVLQRDVQLVVESRANFNGDLRVDFFDWAKLAEKWQNPCSGPDWCDGFDLDFSTLIDSGDVSIFGQDWLMP